MIPLFEIENGVVKPTIHCHTISWLSIIMEKWPEEHLKIYQYIFYMTCPSEEDNPFFNLSDVEKEDAIIVALQPQFSLEEDEINLAIENAARMYETPTVKAYLGIKRALENIATYMGTTTITDGKDGNIAQIRAMAKDYAAIRESYKATAQDLKDEQESHVRGGQNLAYDQ